MLIKSLDELNISTLQSCIDFPFSPLRVEISRRISKSLLRPSMPSRHRMFGLFIRQVLNKYSQTFNSSITSPIGIVSHFSAGNEPLNALYSWFLSFITGNHSYVRVSTRASDSDIELISSIISFLDDVPLSSFFVLNSDPISFAKTVSPYSNVRFIWGSDRNVSSIKKVHPPSTCLDISFGHKLSASLLSIDSIASLSPIQYKQLVNSAINDYFLSDGFMCTSPSSLILYSTTYEKSIIVLKKLLSDCVELSNVKSSSWSLSSFNSKVEYYQSKFSSFSCSVPLMEYNHQYSIAISSQLSSIKNLYRHFDVIHVSDLRSIKVPPGYQTLSYFGIDPNSLPLSLISKFNRCVPVGLSHQFDRYWDGYDLFSFLTRTTSIL